MKINDAILIKNAHDNFISKEEAILKNESSGNSYIINEPSKICCFPNYLIGNIKCTYLINNEKFIGEGVGMLIGEDIILTSAHNLIFSQLEDDNIINCKPHKITFHVLSNGFFKLIGPINCEANNIIFSEYFKDFKFTENKEFDNSNISSTNQNMNKTSNVPRKGCNQNFAIENKNLKNDNLNLNNIILNNNFNDEYKSKSSDYTSQEKLKRKFSKKLIISNISEIPLEDDYAIIFTERKIGIEITSILCEDKTYDNIKEINQDTKIFKLFEEHIDFLSELENLNETKFQNSKISMISGIKYNSNLLGLPQYVYGSTFNDFNSKFSKTKLEKTKKNYNKENTSFIREEKKGEFSTKSNLSKSPLIDESPTFTLDNFSHFNDLDSYNITYKKLNWEKELRYCLLINYDKFHAKKNIRNSKFENLRKLNVFNNEEFYSEGKTVQCEARGKLCSLFFENSQKFRKSSCVKNNCELINPRYEVSNENTTPYFNRQINDKEEYNNNENSNLSILKNPDHIENLSFLNLNENNSFNKIDENKNSNTAFNYDSKQISFNKIFKENFEEILKCSFSQINFNESKEELDKEEVIKEDQIRYLASLDEKSASIRFSTNDPKQSQKDSVLNLFLNNSDLSRTYIKDQKQKNYIFDSSKIGDNTQQINTLQIDYIKTHVSEYLQRESIKSNSYNRENYNNYRSIELNYMITSYKGQSGSPIFIRIKNSKLIKMKKENLINCFSDKYSYIFLGLHSRSPENFEPIIKNKSHLGLSKIIEEENKIQNSTHMNTNKNIQNINKTINININVNEDLNDLKIKIDLKSLIEKHGVSVINELKNIQDNSLFLNNSDYKQIKKQSAIKEFLTKNNYSLYNVGLKINRNIFNKIKESIILSRNLRNSNKELNLNYNMEHKNIDSNLPQHNDSKNYLETKSILCSNLYPSYKDRNYILVNLYIHDEFVVKGIFNITSGMSILFKIAAKYLEVDIKFILLNRKNENIDFENCKDEFILNIYDKSRKENLGKKENKYKASEIFREVINAKFTINIEKYSDLLKEKLISKLTDNIKSFDRNQIYENSENSSLKVVIKYIFNEIQTFFEKSQTIYGLLFDAIKRKIIESPQ